MAPIHTGLNERQMHRRFWLASAGSLLAGLAVALGAYAAHAAVDDQARHGLLQAAVFAFGHGVALAALAPLAVRKWAWWGLLAIGAGVLLFSGSLVAGAWWGFTTKPAPLGGIAMMLGWLLWAFDALRR